MRNTGRRNIALLVLAMVLCVAVIVLATVPVVGDYLYPAIMGGAPFSYVAILVVVIGLIIWIAT